MRLHDIPFEETKSPEPEGPPLSWAFSADSKKRSDWRLFWLLEPTMGALNYFTHHALRPLPLSACSRFGALIAPLAQARFAKAKFAQRLLKNIRLLRPDRADSEQGANELLSGWWTNTGRVFAEFSKTSRHHPDGKIELVGAEHFHTVQAQGKRVIFLSVHVGHWEAQVSALHQTLDIEVTGPFQPEPSRFTNRLIHNLRKRRGQYLFPPGRKSGIRLHRILAANEACGLFYVDDVRENQIHLPLFGRPTPTKGNAVAAIKLAKATGATLIPVFMIRTQGANYQLTFLPPIEQANSGDRAADIETTIKRINGAIEPIILEHIDQWYMLAELRL
ncbi:lysophospholipid acyltransferase family protein [Cohaesibacter marisflavi]|uniref:lysophospholipid acyltransferase family protein n=1 Tax=Cohaesibacter marisflavi TaxID=655353 RepID=UPI0029C8FEBD|nr:lysophospholipid acyltransferase family protein [Cohaesibacter marisflavi]